MQLNILLNNGCCLQIREVFNILWFLCPVCVGLKALWKHNIYGLTPSIASAHYLLVVEFELSTWTVLILPYAYYDIWKYSAAACQGMQWSQSHGKNHENFAKEWIATPTGYSRYSLQVIEIYFLSFIRDSSLNNCPLH